MPQPIGISASRGAAILGVNKYKSPLYAWLEIMEQRNPGFCKANGFYLPLRGDEWGEPLDPKMAPIRWGHGFEDAICDLSGGITDREAFYQNDSFGFPMTCHIDGLKDGRVQENKTAFDMAFKMGWGEPGTDMVPDAYQVQVQHQMSLTGIRQADVNVLVFPKSPAEWERMGYRIDMKMGMMLKDGNGVDFLGVFAKKLVSLGYFHRYRVSANPSVQKKMIENYRLFWNDNVMKETPPPVSGYDDIKWMFASPEGEIEATEEMLSLWSEFVDIDAEISGMKERQTEIKNNVSRMIQTAVSEKKVKPGNEKRKINIYAGARKLFSISRPYPGLRISQSTMDTLKENSPVIYDEMKNTSFLDIFADDLNMTEKQDEKLKKLITENEKFLKSLKLTKLLSRDSIAKTLQRNKPELFKTLMEQSIVYETEPTARLNINKPEKE